MRKLFLFILAIVLLTSCTSRLGKTNKMGDVYILTSKFENNNFTHALFRLESACFIQEVECPAPESIPSFPKDFASYIWADMYWSPDGKYALFVDVDVQPTKDAVEKLLLYDPMDNSIKTVISDYKYISGITWNPNSEWAAMAIKKPDDKDMQIVLVNPDGKLLFPPIKLASDAGYTPHIFNGQVFDDNQEPVQWLNENELIFSRTRGEPTTNPNDFPILPVRHLFKFDLQINEEVEINLPTRAYYRLSPDGSLAHFEADQIEKIYSFESGEILELKDFGLGTSTTNWSPDSKHLFACHRGLSTYIITPDLKKQKKIMDGCPIYAIWMPDSDHIILFFLTSNDDMDIESIHWFVASISAGTVREIFIPDLELTRVDSMNGIYVQPRTP